MQARCSVSKSKHMSDLSASLQTQHSRSVVSIDKKRPSLVLLTLITYFGLLPPPSSMNKRWTTLIFSITSVVYSNGNYNGRRGHLYSFGYVIFFLIQAFSADIWW
jgi:hypothetical protein